MTDVSDPQDLKGFSHVWALFPIPEYLYDWETTLVTALAYSDNEETARADLIADVFASLKRWDAADLVILEPDPEW